MAASDWLEYLNDEDLAFVRRFVLASGSLKKVAQQYDVTYPTIRLRLVRRGLWNMAILDLRPKMD